MQDYNKAQTQGLGVAIFGVIMAVKDGLDPADAGAAMALLGKFTEAANEIQGDSDAAVLDVISGLSGALADSRRDDLQPPAVQ